MSEQVCPKCGANVRGQQDDTTNWWTGHSPIDWLTRQLAAMTGRAEKADDIIQCAFCDFIVSRKDDDWRDKLAEHIQSCEKHPLTHAINQYEALELAYREVLQKLADSNAERDRYKERLEALQQSRAENYIAGYKELKAENVRLRKAESEGSGMNHPKIVCLCGSTRFMDAFFEAGWQKTLAGEIVLSIGVCKHADDHGAEALGDDVVTLLDTLHLRKIDLADYVFVLNVGGYIGKSTAREILYALTTGKPVAYLEVPYQTREDIASLAKLAEMEHPVWSAAQAESEAHHA